MKRLKNIISFLLVAIILVTASSCSKQGDNNMKNDKDIPFDNEITMEGKKYVLTFYDDFNGKKLDTTKWQMCPEWERADEGAKWNSKAVELDGNGNLLLYAKMDENNKPISGGIRTKGIFSQCKGYFECSVKLQKEVGFWGAFWLMCPEEGNIGNGGIDGSEIDIFESPNVKTHQVQTAIHWDGYGPEHRSISKKVYDEYYYDGDYHTFSLLWTDTEYIFYYDREEFWRVNKDTENFPGICTVPTYLKLTTEIGTWAGVYNPEEFPDCMTVDYVVVYQEAK